MEAPSPAQSRRSIAPPKRRPIRRVLVILGAIIGVLLVGGAVFAAVSPSFRSTVVTLGSAVTHPGSQVLREVGPSMLPTIREGQSVLVTPYGDSHPQRGDIVAFHPPPDPQAISLKRIVGLPGERVRIGGDGTVYIDDVPLREPYILNQGTPVPLSNVQLGPHQYFVLGDNRSNSSDSRDWGPILGSSIVGKATVING